MRAVRAAASIGLAFLFLSAAACAPEKDEDESNPLTSIAISPSGEITLGVGSGLQLTATGTYEDATNEDLTDFVTWASNDTDVVTVFGGLLAGIDDGEATVSATYLGQTANANVVVGSGAGFAFDATVTGDWSVAHAAGVPIFVRIIDQNNSNRVFCGNSTLASGGMIDVSAPAVLTTGHTFVAEAVADVGTTVGEVDASDHIYKSGAVGPIGANATLDIPHSGTMSTWPGGVPCP